MDIETIEIYGLSFILIMVTIVGIYLVVSL